MMDIIFTPKFQERFWSKVDKRGPDECWEWQGFVEKAPNTGYGRISVGSQGMEAKAHRVAFLLSGKTIPEGYVIDHLCRNRKCVNPAHLEAVSNQQNILRGIGPTAKNVKKTHCPKGHPYEGDNLAIRPCGARKCLACSREKTAADERTPEGQARKRERSQRQTARRRAARVAAALAADPGGEG